MPLKRKLFIISFLILALSLLQLYPGLSKIFAADDPIWIFDNTPPTCILSPGSGSIVGLNETIPIYMASASEALTSGSLSSNCSIPNLPTTNIPAGTEPFNWTTNAAGQTCTFTLTVKDRAGNPGSCATTLTVSSADPAWIQTTSGDVHSNSDITAYGGPE